MSDKYRRRREVAGDVCRMIDRLNQVLSARAEGENPPPEGCPPPCAITFAQQRLCRLVDGAVGRRHSVGVFPRYWCLTGIVGVRLAGDSLAPDHVGSGDCGGHLLFDDIHFHAISFRCDDLCFRRAKINLGAVSGTTKCCNRNG